MNAEDRITTLILHGCSMYQYPCDSAADPRNRYIDNGTRQRLAYLNLGLQHFTWVLVDNALPISPISKTIEVCEWDTGLIEDITAELFINFIAALTR